jgi:hypothetical protein
MSESPLPDDFPQLQTAELAAQKLVKKLRGLRAKGSATSDNVETARRARDLLWSLCRQFGVAYEEIT